MRTILLSTMLLTFILQAHQASAQAKTDNLTKDDKNWFNERKYLDGLKLIPSQATDVAEFARQYKLNKVVWDKAFTYLKNTDLDKLPIGKYPIDGDNLFATVTDNPTKPYDKTAWESHKKYVDLQYVIQGAEGIAVNAVTASRLTEAYNPEKDVAHYEADGKQYTALPGTFYLFFPGDAHRPNILVPGADHDKKIVLKIRYVE